MSASPLLLTRRTIRSNAVNVLRRNLLAWRKYAWSSITINFAEPFVYFIAFGFGLGAYVSIGGHGTFVAFVAAGLLAAVPMNVATFDAAWGAYERLNVNGVYESMLTAPVDARDIVAGEFLWEAFRSTLYGSLFLIVMALFGLVHSPWAALTLIVLVLTGVVFSIPALFIAAVVPYQEALFYYFSLVITPLFAGSAVFFPLDRLPRWAQDLVWFSPLYHSVRVTRGLVAGNVGWWMLGDIAWLLIFIAIFMPLPMRAMRKKLASR